MRDPFSNYDNWLEAPYQEMQEAWDYFMEWAEEEGYDIEDPQQLKTAEVKYNKYLEDCGEAEAEAAYEAHLDRLSDEMQEREWAGCEDGW